MNTQSITIEPPDETALSSRPLQPHPAAPAPSRGARCRTAHVAATAAVSPDRLGLQAAGEWARILRRWSVADLIARAGGAPRAFA